MDVTYIGGSDGPTSIFIAGKADVNWFNVFGLILVVLILIPNIIYAVKFKDVKNQWTNKFMNILEQIGRYSCMFFMVFNFGKAKFSFSSTVDFIVYFLGNLVLLLVYLIIWILFFIRQSSWKSMALAIIPACVFFLCGITLRHVILIISAVIFAVGHVYVTVQNIKK